MPWQSGFTGLAYDPEKVGKELTSVDDLMDPKLKGKFTLLSEMPDTLGLHHAQPGPRPDHGRRRDRSTRRWRQLEEMAKNRSASSPATTTPACWRSGDIWACFGWSGDVAQLQADNPKLKFVVPEAGGDHLDGQHADPEGRRRVHGVGLHGLRLPAEGRRADRGVRQLHLAGGGRGGGDEGASTRRSRRTRSSSRRRTSSTGSRRSTPTPRTTRTTRRSSPRWSGPDARAAMTNRRLTPYLLLAPGIAFLAVFFVVPLYYLANTSLPDGLDRRRLLAHVGLGQLQRRALDVPAAVHPLDPVRRARDLLRAGDRLPAGVLHRGEGGQVEELPAAPAGHRAVLRHVPDPHAGLADDPGRRRAGHGRAARRSA